MDVTIPAKYKTTYKILNDLHSYFSHPKLFHKRLLWLTFHFSFLAMLLTDIGKCCNLRHGAEHSLTVRLRGILYEHQFAEPKS